MNVSAKFQLQPHIDSEDFFFFFFFFFFSYIFQIKPYANQTERFGQKVYICWRTTQQTFLKKFCPNIANEIAINANFHFIHYKSIEI